MLFQVLGRLQRFATLCPDYVHARVMFVCGLCQFPGYVLSGLYPLGLNVAIFAWYLIVLAIKDYSMFNKPSSARL